MRQLLAFLLAAMMTINLFAAPLSIPLYYSGDCQLLTGTWQGNAYDPQDLFAAGGPFPVTIELVNDHGTLHGKVTSTALDALNGTLLATCNKGEIDHLYVQHDAKQACGELAEPGGLIAKNLLLLRQSWSHAMSGTHFILLLNKTSSSAPFNPSDLPAVPSNPTSCH